MKITTYGFTVGYPEFAGVADEMISHYLSKAMRRCSKRVWGELYPDAVYALAGHFLYLAGYLIDAENGSGDGAPVGQIASHSADGLSESFTTGSSTGTDGDEDFYSTSKYGQDYLSIRRLVRRHMITT